MKLIYHNIEKSNDFSPFDKEIFLIARNQNISIVSPYISLNYLKKIINASNSWKLITDFNEWILSHNTQEQRKDIFEFIRRNKKFIKHVDKIHAKVIINDTSCLIGSANFTRKGICIRDEMAVFISEKKIIDELQSWFNSLWFNSNDYSIEEVNNFVFQNKNLVRSVVSKTEFQPNQKNLRKTSYYSINSKELELIEAIKYMKKSELWINKYLDIIKDLFIDFNIQEDSLKISMSTSRLRMPITIGQRYVIRPPYKNEDTLKLILPLEFEPLEFKEYISNYPSADIDDDYFYKNKIKNARWIRFDSNIVFSNDILLFNFWKESVRKELMKSKKTGYRKTHNPYYYKLVMELEYRNEILNKTIG